MMEKLDSVTHALMMERAAILGSIDPDSVAVMTPLPTVFNGVTKSTLIAYFQSFIHQTYPWRKCIFYFTSLPELFKDYNDFFKEKCKLSWMILSCRHSEEALKSQGRWTEIAQHRNALLNFGKNHRWGIFVDSDVICPPHAISRFIEDDVDIVGGVVVIPMSRMKYSDYIAGEKTPMPGTGLQVGFGFFQDLGKGTVSINAKSIPPVVAEVDFVASACMFLNHKVMNDSRFKFCVVRMGPNKREFSEDNSYCMLAKLLKYQVWIDPYVNCKHLKLLYEKITPLKVMSKEVG